MEGIAIGLGVITGGVLWALGGGENILLALVCWVVGSLFILVNGLFLLTDWARLRRSLTEGEIGGGTADGGGDLAGS